HLATPGDAFVLEPCRRARERTLEALEVRLPVAEGEVEVVLAGGERHSGLQREHRRQRQRAESHHGFLNAQTQRPPATTAAIHDANTGTLYEPTRTGTSATARAAC